MEKVGQKWTQATASDYDALRRPTAAQNDRTSITNNARHIDTCQTVQEVLKSCDMYPFGPLDTRDTSTRFASRCSPTRPQRKSRGTLPPSQPGRTIEPPKRGLSAPRSSEVVVTVPLRTFLHVRKEMGGNRPRSALRGKRARYECGGNASILMGRVHAGRAVGGGSRGGARLQSGPCGGEAPGAAARCPRSRPLDADQSACGRN